MCGNTIDHTDQRIQRIEESYQTLADGTRYVDDRMNANEEIAEAWVHSELANVANAYQTFAREVRQDIMEHTNEAAQRQVCQATQLTRVNNALAILAEANVARSQHLATFQGNVELWAADHQNKVAYLEEQLRKAQEEIQKVATMIPTPASPVPQWRSPVQPPSTSAPASRPPGGPTKSILGSPLYLGATPPQQRQRMPAIPATPPPLRGLLARGAGGPPSTPPLGPSTPPLPPSPPHQVPTP